MNWNPNARRQREVDTRADTGNETAIGNHVTPDDSSFKFNSGLTLKGGKTSGTTRPMPVSKPTSRSQDS